MSALDRLKALVATAQYSGAPPSKRTDKGDESHIAPPFVASVAPGVGALSENRQTAPECDADRWRHHFEERAAIREQAGGISRVDAEHEALLDCAQQWRCENPLAPSEPHDPCVHCRERMTTEDRTPVIAEPGAHAWLHAHCWAPMNAARRQQALDAVRAMLGTTP